MARGIDGIDGELLVPRDDASTTTGREVPAPWASSPRASRVTGACSSCSRRRRGELGARLAAAWAGREFNAFYERPLLLLGCAALRGAVCDAGRIRCTPR